MIAYIRGEILDRDASSLTLLAGDAGVGYLVMVPDRAEYLAFQAGKTAELFIYTHVREDSLALFGFLSREEKRLFLMLLSVSGIGPKGALSILAGMNADSLIQAILERNLAALVAIQGVGKKTAERVLLELSDPLAKRMEQGEFASRHLARSFEHSSSHSNPLVAQARAALVGLGFKDYEAEHMVLSALQTSDSPPSRVEDIVRGALRGTNH